MNSYKLPPPIRMKSVLPSPLKSPVIGVKFADGGLPKFHPFEIVIVFPVNVPSPLLRNSYILAPLIIRKSVLPSALKSPATVVKELLGGLPKFHPFGHGNVTP